MSYVLHVWEYPVPRDGEADAVLKALRAHRFPPSPRFQALGRALTARFPDWGDDDSVPAVWVDSPMDGNVQGAVWTIGIVSDYLDEAYPFLVETAGRLRLCVHDPQNGDTFLPELTWWPHWGQEHDAALGRRLDGLDVSLVEDIFAQELAPVLEVGGFHRVGGRFVRPTEEGWQSVRCALAKPEAGPAQLVVYLGVHLRAVIDALAATEQDIRPTEAWGGWGFSLHDLLPGANPGTAFPVRSMLELMQVLHTCRGPLASKGLPMLDRARTLDGLYQMVSEQTEHGGFYTSPLVLSILIVLARQEQVALMPEKYIATAQRLGEDHPDARTVTALVDYVCARRRTP